MVRFSSGCTELKLLANAAPARVSFSTSMLWCGASCTGGLLFLAALEPAVPNVATRYSTNAPSSHALLRQFCFSAAPQPYFQTVGKSR